MEKRVCYLHSIICSPKRIKVSKIYNLHLQTVRAVFMAKTENAGSLQAAFAGIVDSQKQAKIVCALHPLSVKSN